MSEVAQQGRTVLLVSHQLNQIRRLCGYAIWLVDGHVGSAGSMLETVAAYEASLTSPALDAPAQQRAFQGPARFIGWEIAEPRGEASNVLAGLGPVVLRVLLEVGRSVADGHHGIALFNSDNQLMWATAVDHLRLAPGTHTLQYTLPSLPLRPGTYQWHLSLYDSGQLLDLWYSNPQMIIGTEPVTHPLDAWQGVLNLPCTFEAL
jgi:lipopolysaccharide transport system ATP-binding protein